MAIVPNRPAEDAAGSEAVNFLRLARDMQSLFHRGYAQNKIILGILILYRLVPADFSSE
jgi:hypothetical protein